MKKEIKQDNFPGKTLLGIPSGCKEESSEVG